MPIALSPKLHPRANKGLIKFTNCRLVKGDGLVPEDLWVSSVTGTIINSQANFFDELVLPDETIDLGGRIVSPGMIECQLNGAFGFNFSTLLDDMSRYGKKVHEINRFLVQTGVTSYLPTITSQRPELYQKVNMEVSPIEAVAHWVQTCMHLIADSNHVHRRCHSSDLQGETEILRTAPNRSVLTARGHF